MLSHVIIGKPDFESQVCWIDTNNHLSGQIAAEHLCSCGFKRIAFVGGEPNDEISMQRLKGFNAVMEEKGLPIPPDFIKYGDSTKASGFLLTNELLDGGNCPQAIICENNNIALGVVNSINEHAMDEGAIKNGEASFMAYTFFGTICSAAVYELINKDKKEVADVIDNLTNYILKGIEA